MTIRLFYHQLPKICILLSSLFLSNVTFSQEVADGELRKIVEQVYNDTQSKAESVSSIHQVNSILGKKCAKAFGDDSQYFELIDQAEYWDKNYGLELRGGLTSGDLESSEFDEEGTTYLELSWDVLKNGYKDYEFKARELRRKADLKKLAANLDKLSNDYRCRGYQIQKMFVGLDGFLSNQKLQLLEAVYPIERRAYLEGASYFDDMLISEGELVNVRQKIEHLYTLYGSSPELFTIENPPIIDIHIVKILADIDSDSKRNELRNLERQALSDSNPYDYGSRLRLFVRKEFDLLSSNRDDLVAGVRFSIPLTMADEPSNYYKIQRLEQEASFQGWERITRVRAAYESFRQQKERTVTQKYRYLRSKERMRRIEGRRLAGENLNISAVIARLNTYINASIELAEAKKSLYQRANQVFLASGIAYSPELIKISDISVPNYRSREFQNSLYVWSKSVEKLTPEQLVLFAKTKGITKLLLSNSRSSDPIKQRKIIELSKREGILLDLIVGDNSWVNEDKWNIAANNIAVASEITGRIHLDIEPQALDDYQQNKLRYQKNYLSMIKAIRKASPEQYISVAVPFHWEVSTYEQLKLHVQSIFIMNYGTTKVDTLARRANKILTVVPHEKVSIVLSMKDFKNEYELEQAFKQLHQLTGINQFGIHKLEDFLNMGGVN